MRHRHHGEQWMQDIEARQRNVVFPDTVQNEARFWRNLGSPPFSTAHKIGLFLLCLFFFGGPAAIVYDIVRWDTYGTQEIAETAILTLLVAGSFFGIIAWTANRTLRNSDAGQ
jgi:hypothetical protein